MKSTLRTYLFPIWVALFMAPSMLLAQSDTTNTSGSIDLENPSNYEREIIFDPITGNYLVYKMIGDVRLPIPEVWTTDQYRQFMYDSAESDYFSSKSSLFNASG